MPNIYFSRRCCHLFMNDKSSRQKAEKAQIKIKICLVSTHSQLSSKHPFDDACKAQINIHNSPLPFSLSLEVS